MNELPQQQDASPQMDKSLSPKVLLAVILILVFSASIVYGAILWWGNKSGQVATTQFTPRPSISANTMVDWETYTNTKYGYEFKYPHDYIIFTSLNSRQDDIVPPDSMSIKVVVTKNDRMIFCCEATTFRVEIQNEKQNNLDTWVNQEFINSYNTYRVARKGYELFAGQNAYRVYSTVGIDSPGDIVAFNHAGTTFFIRYDDVDIFNQILSTFRFIDTKGIGTLTGKVSIGPNCPDERVGVMCTPSPEAYVSREFIVLDSNQKEITRFHADASGSYTLTLSAGTYTVESAKTGMGYMSKDLPATVTIKAGQTTSFSIDVDTGIR